MKYLYWKTRILFLSLKWIFKFNLGDEVIYKGKSYMLMQGVMHPRWSLAGEHEYIEVYEKDFRKALTFKNLYGSFKSGWNFYNGNWFGIWMRNGIEPWMKSANIW